MDYTKIPTNHIISSSKDKFDTESLLEKLKSTISQVSLPKDLQIKINAQLQQLESLIRHGGGVTQLDLYAKYIDWVINLPWEKMTEDQLDLKNAQQIMDKSHFGLTQIKRRVLEYLSVISLQKKQNLSTSHAPILFFVGLAGTGKTTFAKSIAPALNRNFARVPFGGLASALDLRGLSKVQPEAEPGQIIKALRRVGSKNPVILLDELDRIVDSAHSEIMGVLLELLDPQQNDKFVDHYIDFPFDLSQVIFVGTANNTKNISTAVLDRLEVIQMPSYTDEDKIKIAKDFVLPNLLKDSGIGPNALKIDEAVWQHMARTTGFDPGIRSVERKVESIVRKIAFQMISTGSTSFSITKANMSEFFE